MANNFEIKFDDEINFQNMFIIDQIFNILERDKKEC